MTTDAWPAEVRYEDATAPDLPAIRALLETVDLPTADVGAEGQIFLVARAGDAVLGCVALEPHGEDVLLRSLAVSPARQGTGIGRTLHARAIALARERGFGTAYLLTTTAERLFAREGYDRIERSEVPAEVRASAEFAALCPATAVCMARRLR
jgi:amino-acid N-acetyltransferase